MPAGDGVFSGSHSASQALDERAGRPRPALKGWNSSGPPAVCVAWNGCDLSPAADAEERAEGGRTGGVEQAGEGLLAGAEERFQFELDRVAVGLAVGGSEADGDGWDQVGISGVGGQGVANAQMDTTWHYKTTTSGCSGTTDASGTASCTRLIGRATIGYTVKIDVVFTAPDGTRVSTATSFTPR
jgi:hypothetical protein